ncbi:MAG: IPT/TIG domain-containing protein [Rhodococcus sp. (in: high G+C Gram-positive bacteria)]
MRLQQNAWSESGEYEFSATNIHSGESVRLAQKLVVVPAPSADNLPWYDSRGGEEATANGWGLNTITRITIDGMSVPFTADGHVLRFTTVPHPPGPARVLFHDRNGNAYPYGTDPVYYNPFSVNSITPDAGPAAGGTAVTITGTGFSDVRSVRVGDARQIPVTVISDSEMRFVTPPAGNAGGVDFLLYSHRSLRTLPGVFTYLGPADPVGVTPSTGTVAGGTEVTVTGSGFTGATSVLFGDTVASEITVIDDTKLRVFTPSVADAGALDITIRTPRGDGTLKGAFTYLGLPRLIEVAPSVGSNAGGTQVTVAGSGLTGATSVRFGGASVSEVNVVSDSEMHVIAPASTDTGVVDVTVSTPRGDDTLSDAFTYESAPGPSPEPSPGPTPDPGPVPTPQLPRGQAVNNAEVAWPGPALRHSVPEMMKAGTVALPTAAIDRLMLDKDKELAYTGTAVTSVPVLAAALMLTMTGYLLRRMTLHKP